MKCAIKYAPQTLADVIYPNQAVQTRIDAYARGLLENNIILHGTNGTGKSTIARLLPNAIVGGQAIVENDDFDELLSRKDLKMYLRNTCSMSSMTEQSKVFLVFEEFDNAKVNLNKLWTAMDACADSLQVIISTNNLMDIHKSIRSRCDLINVHKLSAQAVLPRAQFILRSEGVELPDDYVLGYLQQADWRGDLRLYLQKLDELLATQVLGMPLPAVNLSKTGAKPDLQVISSSGK